MNVKKFPSTQLWINGAWQDASSKQTFETLNPATGKCLAEVARAGEKDVDLAVQAARRALQETWAALKSRERGNLLYRLSALIEQDAENLAVLESMDSGKPYRDSYGIDIPSSAEAFRYFAGWADKLGGETVPVDPGFFTFTTREPLGVIAAITPWNFPLSIASQRLAAALACGNTVILKPAEQTPLTALRLAELSSEAGFPPGVLNILCGTGEEAGAALVRHSGVDGVTFTGERNTGQTIMKNAAPALKRLSLELGGKSPNIIFEDADLESAAKAACSAVFFNQGEVCCAGTRLLVHEGIHDVFLEKVLKEAGRWISGDPFDERTAMGPLVSREQYEKVQHYIKLGQTEGARLCLDGRRDKPSGFFMGPTVFDRVRPEMSIAREEIFGPVLSVLTFRDYSEALDLANDTPYGLAASIWTRDLARAHRAVRSLKAGTVWVNCYGQDDQAMPFGGWKGSGFGREGGRAAFEFYTQTRSVWISL